MGVQRPAPTQAQEREVLVALSRLVRTASFGVRESGRASGIGGSHLLVLQLLEAEGARKAGEIAKSLLFSKSTTTAILDSLEERDLIVRHRDKIDGRSIVVSLTKTGTKALASAPAAFHAHFLTRFRILPEWERALILSALLRMCDMLIASSGVAGS